MKNSNSGKIAETQKEGLKENKFGTQQPYTIKKKSARSPMESGVRDPELWTMISRPPMKNNAENPRKKSKTS